MGAVYRARDTRLGRDVAVKVSDQKFGERFEREAHVISSLNHPNICHLYDVGENYLVMELVENVVEPENGDGSLLFHVRPWTHFAAPLLVVDDPD